MKPTTRPTQVCVILIFFCCSFTNEKSTRSFAIKGRVKEEKNITIEDLHKLTLHTIGSVAITNHKGDAKGKAKHMKGVLLKDILQTTTLDSDNPKLFSDSILISSEDY